MQYSTFNTGLHKRCFHVPVCIKLLMKVRTGLTKFILTLSTARYQILTILYLLQEDTVSIWLINCQLEVKPDTHGPSHFFYHLSVSSPISDYFLLGVKPHTYVPCKVLQLLMEQKIKKKKKIIKTQNFFSEKVYI